MTAIDARMGWNFGGEFWAGVLVLGIAAVANAPAFAFSMWRAFHGQEPGAFIVAESNIAAPHEGAQTSQSQRAEAAQNKAEG